MQQEERQILVGRKAIPSGKCDRFAKRRPPVTDGEARPAPVVINVTIQPAGGLDHLDGLRMQRKLQVKREHLRERLGGRLPFVDKSPLEFRRREIAEDRGLPRRGEPAARFAPGGFVNGAVGLLNRRPRLAHPGFEQFAGRRAAIDKRRRQIALLQEAVLRRSSCLIRASGNPALGQESRQGRGRCLWFPVFSPKVRRKERNARQQSQIKSRDHVEREKSGWGYNLII